MMTTKMQQVNILGTTYVLKEQTVEENPALLSVDGYCDMTVKEICVRREHTGTAGDKEWLKKSTIRHEIIHAFLAESGLDVCSCCADSWATNEEMVDWFALQGPRIHRAWEAVGAL